MSFRILSRSLAAVLLAATATFAPATNVGTGLVSQLIYLGEDARADRIPLAPVIFNANYHYGMHGLIFEPRPCHHGHLMVAGVPTYEQNLAVLYGLEGEFSDPTQLPGSTFTLRLLDRKPPVGSPYSLEQIAAAAIQCVLMHAGGLSEESPLTVVIEGHDIPTPEWAAKYNKPYFHDEHFKEFPQTPPTVPGIRVERLPRGECYLVFEDVQAEATRAPVFIPWMGEGETGDNDVIHLVPLWHGGGWKESLNVLARPILPYYEMWLGGLGGRNAETVALPHSAPPGFPDHTGPALHVIRGDGGTHIDLFAAIEKPEQLAAFIFACVISEMPTLKHPLSIKIYDRNLPDEYRERLKADAAWDEGRCEFAFDPAELKLTRGSVPGFSIGKGYGWGAMISKN